MMQPIELTAEVKARLGRLWGRNTNLEHESVKYLASLSFDVIVNAALEEAKEANRDSGLCSTIEDLLYYESKRRGLSDDSALEVHGFSRIVNKTWPDGTGCSAYPVPCTSRLVRKRYADLGLNDNDMALRQFHSRLPKWRGSQLVMRRKLHAYWQACAAYYLSLNYGGV